MVKFPNERLGARKMTNHMRRFNSMIQELQLVDLPLRGATYTWINDQNRRVSSRLDRFLLSSDWIDIDPMYLQEALPSTAFDHILIVLRPF